MCARLLIHVGDYKTGSTSIQTCLSEGLWRCETHSLAYPCANPHHMVLAKAMRLRKPDPARDDLFRQTAQAVRNADADTVVLSAEHFQGVRPARLLKWVETYLPEMADDMCVLAYVRPHAEFTLSLYAERVKLGATTDPIDTYLPRFLENDRIRFAPRFMRWRRVFGDRFILRPVVAPLLAGGDALNDFLNIALEGHAFDLNQGHLRSNPSLSAEDLWFMRHVHARISELRPDLDKADRRRFGNALYSVLSDKGPSGTPLGLTSDQIALVQDSCNEDARAMDRAFFPEGALAPALAEADKLSCPDLDAPTDHVSARQRLALLRSWPKFMRSASEADGLLAGLVFGS